MPSNEKEIYISSDGGLIVEVVKGGAVPQSGGAEMKLVEENTQEAATEKHIPVVEKVDGGVKVVVGEVAHPMLEEHSIEWIELIAGDKVYRQHLKPGAPPEAFFPVSDDGAYARAYCNLHGLWKS